MLWCGSMPCNLPDENAIPIAHFGRSNVGRAKTLYRVGLSHRYGRRMQMISGIHYNFSLSEESWPLADFRDFNEAYFALIRNFRRHAWLLLYLFGASPAVCSSFVEGRAHELRELAPGTLYRPPPTKRPDPSRIPHTSRSASAKAKIIGSLPRACCRLRTNSTVRFARSAWCDAVSGRCGRYASGACSTSRFAQWIWIRSPQ